MKLCSLILFLVSTTKAVAQVPRCDQAHLSDFTPRASQITKFATIPSGELVANQIEVKIRDAQGELIAVLFQDFKKMTKDVSCVDLEKLPKGQHFLLFPTLVQFQSADKKTTALTQWKMLIESNQDQLVFLSQKTGIADAAKMRNDLEKNAEWGFANNQYTVRLVKILDDKAQITTETTIRYDFLEHSSK